MSILAFAAASLFPGISTSRFAASGRCGVGSCERDSRWRGGRWPSQTEAGRQGTGLARSDPASDFQHERVPRRGTIRIAHTPNQPIPTFSPPPP